MPGKVTASTCPVQSPLNTVISMRPQRAINDNHLHACRAKFGEAAFLDVYQKLYEAPDPAPPLAFALVRALSHHLLTTTGPEMPFSGLEAKHFRLRAQQQSWMRSHCATTDGIQSGMKGDLLDDAAVCLAVDKRYAICKGLLAQLYLKHG